MTGILHAVSHVEMLDLISIFQFEILASITPANVVLQTDIITQYAFDKSWNNLDEADFNVEWKNTMRMSFSGNGLTRQFPWIPRTVDSMPLFLVRMMVPAMEYFLDWRSNVLELVRSIVEPESQPIDVKVEDDTPYKTIFHTLRHSNLPIAEKSLQRLTDEAVIVVGGGAETTGRALNVISYHLINNPAILSNLRSELKTIWPDSSHPVNLSALDHAPYLTAIIQEGIRLGGSSCLPSGRTAPDETLTYKGWSIPPGTAVSMTSCMLLYDETIFPDPLEFQPERWLTGSSGKPERNDKRTKPFFSVGSRSCIGMNLAYSELYLTIAEMFRRFDFELYETNRSDVDIAEFCIAGLVKSDTAGIRVKVSRKLDD